MFRLGTKEYIRRIFTNLFIALQLAAAFFIIASIIASIRTRTTLYDPIKEYLDKDGAYIALSNTSLGGIDSEEKLKEQIPEAEDLITAYHIYFEMDTTGKTIAYDKRIGKKYTPSLDEGKWLDFDNTDEITAVVSYSSPYKVGDVIDVIYPKFIKMDEETYTPVNENIPVKIRIVGRLSEDAKLYGMGKGFAQNDDFRNLYERAAEEEEEEEGQGSEPVSMIISKEAAENHGCTCSLGISKALITLKDGLSAEEADAAYAKLNAIGAPIRMESFASRTKRYVYDQLIQLSPILISIIMLVTVSTIAISALNAKMGMKTNAIYALMGCTMKSCIGIYLVNSLLTAFTSALMCAVFVNGMKIAGRLQTTVIAFGLPEILGCAAMGGIYLICAISSPVIYLSKATIKEQLAVSE
ncbi:MAG: hypothetical protein IKR76_07830 [Ruminococcus sp.]|nr:hypothetical protein [Ruminococcus sp.]